ncbi:hypothetical protein HK102_002490 [Quaeritorhiza haematococci]|nr:hypothetical protein HK102_002490 [Quaeritorhiza haematococci]
MSAKGNFDDYWAWWWVGDRPGIAAFAATDIFWIATSVVYYLRRNHEYLQPRLIELVLVNTICLFVMINQFMFEFPVLHFGVHIPCVWFMIVYHFVAPTWVFTIFLRTGQLLLTYVSAQARLELSIHGKVIIYSTMNRFERAMLRTQFFFFGSNPEQWLAGNNRKVGIQQLLKTFAVLTFVQAAVFVISIGIKRGDLSICNLADYAVLFVFFGVFLLLIPYLLYSIRTINETFRMLQEMVLIMLNIYVWIVVYFLTEKLSHTTLQSTTNTLFFAVMAVVHHCIQVVYPVTISFISDYRRKNLSLRRDSFEKTIADPVLFQEFKKVLAQEFTIENALFVETYLCMKKRTLTLKSRTQRPLSLLESPLKRTTDVGEQSHIDANLLINHSSNDGMATPAQVITIQDEQALLFDKFVRAGAPYELNIPHQVRAECEERLNAAHAESRVSIDAFEGVYREVCDLMYHNSFPRFVRRRQKMKEKGKVAPL